MAGAAPGRGRRRVSRSWWPRAPGTAGMAWPGGRCGGTIRTQVERNRLWAKAEAPWPYLSPDLRARLDRGPAELAALHPSRVPGVPVAVRAVRDAVVRNDPIGGRATGGGGVAIGDGEQRPYTRLGGGGGGGDVAVRAACRGVRGGEVRNDPIGGRATGGGGVAIGAGEQRPYTRLGGGGGDVAVRAACRAVRGGEVRNDPIGGRATGGGGVAIGAGATTLCVAGRWQW